MAEANRNSDHHLECKVLESPVQSAAHANGTHEGRSGPGSTLTGHQQNAEPITVRDTRKAPLRMDVI